IDWKSAVNGGGGALPLPSGWPLASRPAPLPAHALTIVTLHRTNRRMPDTQTIPPLLAGEIAPRVGAVREVGFRSRRIFFFASAETAAVATHTYHPPVTSQGFTCDTLSAPTIR